MLKRRPTPSIKNRPYVPTKKNEVQETTIKPEVVTVPPEQPHVTITENVSAFDKLVELATAKIENRANKVNEIREAAKAAENEVIEAQRELQRLHKIKSMVNNINAPYEWHKVKRGPSEFYKTVWSEELTYKTSTLRFTIVLSELAAHKKEKWTVDVQGIRTKIAASGYSELGDIDYQYAHKKYLEKVWSDKMESHWEPSEAKGNRELNKSFATEKEARKFVKEWQERLVLDHTEEIEYEASLFNQCKG